MIILEPHTQTTPKHGFSNLPVWAMAFRPFYGLAALYGALAILLWGFSLYGTIPWHAHEMIWGYAGLVVVAFLLTAGATWTGQPAVSGIRLIILTLLWLLARIFTFLPEQLYLSGIFGSIFYWLASFFLGQAVVRSKNTRNYIAVFALFLFGFTHAAFHIYAYFGNADGLQQGWHAGLVMVAGFIGFIGTRIISFFTSRRLNTQQIASPTWLAYAPLVLPILMAILMTAKLLPSLVALLGLLVGIIGLVQGWRWLEKGVWQEPLLWVLHLGYALTSLGLILMGLGQLYPHWISMGVHLIAVGGIGLLTIGMMARTALGHTGQMLYPVPKPMPLAFILMALAALFRVLAAALLYIHPIAYSHSIRLSAVLFALSLLLFAWRYIPWLLRPRLDGRAG